MDIYDADCICQLLTQINLESCIFDCCRLNKITACQVHSEQQGYALSTKIPFNPLSDQNVEF